MKLACLFNPKASGWRQSAEMVTKLARAEGVPCWSVCDQSGWISNLGQSGVDRIVVCGGDGTLSLVANQLDRFGLLADFQFGLVPLGTGNDFARSTGLQGLPIDEAWRWAVDGNATPIDLIRAENGSQHVVVNAATGGFGGLVTSDVSRESKSQWGAMAYWFTAFSHLVDPEEYRIRVDINDKQIELETFGLAVTSARYVGGGFPVCPHSYLDDGLLDVTVVPVMEMVEAIAAGVDFSLGRHIESGRVPCFQGESVRIIADPILPYSLDGEATRSFDATFAVMPSAIHFVVGKEAPAVRKMQTKEMSSVI